MIKKYTTMAGLFVAGFAATLQAQGPMYDKVIVDLPYRVTLNDTTIEPGHYVIRQLDSPGGGSRVLQIFTDNGMRLKTTTMTIPALDINTARSTRVILHHYGNDYYFDKIWIQGKDYGYEFPLPPSVKSRERERMESYSVAAQYEQTKETDKSTATDNSNTTISAAPAPAPAPAVSTEVARNDQPAAAPVPEPGPAPVQSAPAPAQMPHTASNWVTLLFGGSFLAGAGLLLRRRASNLG